MSEEILAQVVSSSGEAAVVAAVVGEVEAVWVGLERHLWTVSLVLQLSGWRKSTLRLKHTIL
jgi:hypothetical protein